MILAVYTKNKSKDKWSLYAVAESMETAKKYSKQAIKKANKIGYDDADSVIQGFETAVSIPKNLEKVEPEAMFYN